jgi:hypothetical protein
MTTDERENLAAKELDEFITVLSKKYGVVVTPILDLDLDQPSMTTLYLKVKVKMMVKAEGELAQPAP